MQAIQPYLYNPKPHSATNNVSNNENKLNYKYRICKVDKRLPDNPTPIVSAIAVAEPVDEPVASDV